MGRGTNAKLFTFSNLSCTSQSQLLNYTLVNLIPNLFNGSPGCLIPFRLRYQGRLPSQCPYALKKLLRTVYFSSQLFQSQPKPDKTHSEALYSTNVNSIGLFHRTESLPS